MKNKRLFLILCVVYLLFCGIMYRQNNKIVDRKLSIVDINDIVCTISENIQPSMEKETVMKQEMAVIKELVNRYHHDISILDNNEILWYQSSSNADTFLADAYESGDIVMNLTIEGQQNGYVLISNHSNYIDSKQRNIQIWIVLSGVIILLILIIYDIYIERRVIRPFRKLNHFAKDIAAGNLDAPLVMDRGNIFGAFTESFDIMREQLSIAKENEKKANESKKELVASLSHDIKTPLASIKALAEVLQVTMIDDKQLDKVRSIEKKAIQIEELTNNLFHSTLEELNTIKVEVQEEESNLLVDMLYRVDYQHKITSTEIPECFILCDKLRLEQVLDNIIFNSYKYADTDITVTSLFVDNYLEILFRDYGPGVDDKELPLLMQKYYRGTNAKGKNGAGIGLFMSQYFMTKMNGSITAYNTNDGFEVCIRIPLC